MDKHFVCIYIKIAYSFSWLKVDNYSIIKYYTMICGSNDLQFDFAL